MNINSISRGLLALTALTGAMCAGNASAAVLDLTGQGYYTYGNTNSYSLPIIAYQYDLANGGGTGPGSPYYVASSPGQIKDFVVIYTGAAGTDVTTNAQGFEDAYQTPNGSSPSYASTDGTNVISPTGTATKGITTYYSNTWDANVGALTTFLDGGNPLFLFNNNDTNNDQNLAIWAKLWITDPNGNLYNNRYLYLSNMAGQYGAGGVPMGDATIYNPGNVAPQFYPGGGTDYVLSGGSLCVSKTTGQVTGTPPCAAGSEAINHNLGANQAAYAADLPLLNDWLATLAGNLNVGEYSLHLELVLGCDAVLQGNCDNFQIDNGYEQLFLVSSKSDVPNVPEPGSLVLVGLGLAGLAYARHRREARI